MGQLYAIMDPIGKLAIVGPLAVEWPAYVRKITATVVVVVYVLASIFALACGFILSAFGVSIDSFRIAGGVVLLAISIMTLVSGSYVGKYRNHGGAGSGAVGHASDSGPRNYYIIVISSVYGSFVALLAAFLASTAVAATLLVGIRVIRYVGATPLRLFGRFMSLIIASVATEMILTGIQNSVKEWML